MKHRTKNPKNSNTKSNEKARIQKSSEKNKMTNNAKQLKKPTKQTS